MSAGTIEIACPSCGTVSHFEDLTRDAGAFCRVCDFPLFWARPPRAGGLEEEQGADGLRRLPGTAGRVELATIDCPVCTEPNPISATICIRCGSDLRPGPVTEVLPAPPPPQPAPPPPPPPPPPKRQIWPWILLAVLAIAAIVVLLVLVL